MGLAVDYLWFEQELAKNGLSHLLVESHEAAAASELSDCIVYIPDEKTGKLDVYLVGKKDGIFTEYVCWVSDEFLEDDELIYTVIEYIFGAYKGEGEVADKLKEMNPHLLFFDYPKEDYGSIYEAMNK